VLPAVICNSIPVSSFAYAKKKQWKEAKYYKRLEENQIECLICPRKCRVFEIERGTCGVKENRGGKYYTLVYGEVCALHIDPIEKKPFFHFLPGTTALSLSTAGCNFDCKYCQNWQISQKRPEQVQNIPAPPVVLAKKAKKERCSAIAYTYGEPVVFYEYMIDIAIQGRKYGVKNVMISNGYINPQPMRELCKYLDGVKIDLKGFTEEFYKKITTGTLKPVLKTLEILREEKIWFEIVYLVVPSLNDSKNELKALCSWIRKQLGSNVPVHFSRFYPTYKLKNLPPTPKKTLELACNIGYDCGLNYVYIGNMPGHKFENTICPKCKKYVIKRYGYFIISNNVKNGKCKNCGNKIPGVWS
jgi:pyruvate formate lyase activating enzyme